MQDLLILVQFAKMGSIYMEHVIGKEESNR